MRSPFLSARDMTTNEEKNNISALCPPKAVSESGNGKKSHLQTADHVIKAIKVMFSQAEELKP